MKLSCNSEKYSEQPARMLQEMLLLFVTERRHRILRRNFRENMENIKEYVLQS